MKFLIRNTANPRRKPLAPVLTCLVCACVSLPALAAPGDQLMPPRASEANTIDRPAGTLFEYLRIAGSTFHPLDNATTYDYPGAGCIAKTGGVDARFAHKVILPEGAGVRYLRLYYYDTSSSDVVAFFTTYDGAGNFSERGSVSSIGGLSGYNSVVSSDINYTVDPFSSAINVVANLGTQDNSTLRFCGVRIAYDRPISDRIFANGFELTPL